jgi:transcriptional regulator with XRE-family HTH domain
MNTKRRINQADENVGRLVRLRRMQLCMSQTQLGNEVGVTFQQVQKYEQGANRVSAGRLQKIASVLNVPVTYFFVPLSGVREANQPILDFLDNASALRLIEAFSRIQDRKMQRRILQLVEQAAGPKKHGK